MEFLLADGSLCHIYHYNFLKLKNSLYIVNVGSVNLNNHLGQKNVNIFLYSSVQTFALGVQKNFLIEMVVSRLDKPS